MVIFGFMMSTGCTVTNLLLTPMIHLATETDDTFESYISKDISINWESQAGTVYGGTIDLVSGKMIVNYKYGIVGPPNTGSDFSLTSEPIDAYSNTYVYYNSTIGSSIIANTADEITKALCSHLPSISRTLAGASYKRIGVFQFHSGSTNQFRFAFPKMDSFSTNAKLQEWL